jgi:hypothetical protein
MRGNSCIVTLPSFSIIAHLGRAVRLAWWADQHHGRDRCVFSMFTAKRVKSRTLTRIFAVALVLLAIQRVVFLLSA